MAEFEHSDVVVVRAKRVRNGYSIKFLVGNSIFEAFSSFPIAEGSYGSLKGVLTPGGMVVKEARVEQLSEEDLHKIKANLEKSIPLEDVDPLAEMPTPMWEALKAVARKVKVAELINSYNVMRYHGDADGISSAFQLSFLPSLKIQQGMPFYTAKDALSDLNGAHSSAKFLLLLDFVGEDADGVEIAKAGGFDIVVLDHHEHPPYEGITEVNPWHFGLDSSYTAGYLAYEVARLLGRGEEEFLYTSLAGDKSDLLPVSEEHRERAMVLDFLATNAGYSNSLDFYRKILNSPSLYKTIVMQAEDSILELKQLIVRHAKKRELEGAVVYLLNTDAVKRKRDFPSRAKLTTLLFEMVKDKPSIAIGHSSRVITFRLSPLLAEKGVDVRAIIDTLKERYPDVIISGGGHPRAGSVIFLEGYKDLLLNEVFSILHSMVKGDGH